CGGTHVTRTNEIGPIKLLKTERVQDGVERIEFSAGLAAVRHIQKMEEVLKEAAEKFSVQSEELPKTAERFFTEWKDQRKKIEEMSARLAELEARDFHADFAANLAGVPVAVGVKASLDANALRNLAQEASKKSKKTVAIVNAAGQFVVARPEGAPGDAGAIAKALAEGKAGGKPDLAQGVVPGVPEGLTGAALAEWLAKKLGAAK
ncbi:MAG: DHHA1 domain-containing protein, partial [Thermoplasmatota archaeon]